MNGDKMRNGIAGASPEDAGEMHRVHLREMHGDAVEMQRRCHSDLGLHVSCACMARRVPHDWFMCNLAIQLEAS